MLDPDAGPLRLLVIQPTPFCNLNCDYCYLPGRHERSRMAPEILDAALDRVLESPYLDGPFTLLWHAGEPLSLPPAFYDIASERISAALERHGLPRDLVRQSLQTNGINLNEAWCDCFERHGIHVGVSLDGPAFLHDAHRRTRSGLPSHAAVMRGISWLQRRRIPFNVIAVLTDESLDHADALYEFFADHGIGEVGFNMEETEGANPCSSLDAVRDRAALEKRYQAFLQRFWQRSLAEPGRVRLREFEGMLTLACTEERLQHTDMNRPFVIVNVDVNGAMSSFDPELLGTASDRFGRFAFGQVQHHSLAAMATDPRFQAVRREIAEGVERCRRECAYFGLCGGGAGSNKYFEHGRFDGSETQACRYRIQLVAEVVLAEMERDLELA